MTTNLQPKQSTRTQKPKQYAVVLVNDDFTPMDFVVALLMQVFQKSAEEAEALTMDIHKKGKGVAGVYTLEVAETKALQVESIARQQEFPLKASIDHA